MYPEPKEGFQYHVFGNGWDDWTTSLKEAREIVRSKRKYPYQRIDYRVYIETDWDSEIGIYVEEAPVLSVGEFPC